MDSSYAYAEKIDASTARRSLRLGEDSEARVRKARKIRRKESDVVVGEGVEVEVSRAVNVRWTRVLNCPRSFSLLKSVVFESWRSLKLAERFRVI